MGLPEFAPRTALAALALTLVTPIVWLPMIGLFGRSLEVFAVAGAVVVPLGGLLLQWVYRLDEWTEGLGVFLLYLTLPVALMLASWYFALTFGGLLRA